MKLHVVNYKTSLVQQSLCKLGLHDLQWTNSFGVGNYRTDEGRSLKVCQNSECQLVVEENIFDNNGTFIGSIAYPKI